MPVVLEQAEGQLDVIGERCTLREGMLFLVDNHVRMSHLELVKLCEGLLKHAWVLLTKELLSLSSDYYKNICLVQLLLG